MYIEIIRYGSVCVKNTYDKYDLVILHGLKNGLHVF